MVTNDRTWLEALAAIAVCAMAVGCTFDREGGLAPEGGVPQVDAAEAGVDVKEPVQCFPPNKLCGEECAELNDPDFGCAPGTCDPCPSRPQSVMGCSNKECVITDCEDSHWNCNGDPKDGCEIDLWSMDHCGACGEPCVLSNAESVCNQGSCEVGACDFGWGDCDFAHETGCETGLRDNANCGACGNPCIVTGGQGTCVTGTCLVDLCDPGRADCNGDTSDGCETDLTSVDDCGACGISCNPPNAVGDCDSGTCKIASCMPGFGDCNTNPLDGCETNLRQNVDHCGTCDTPCEGANVMSRACSDGLCVPTCQSGWKDCNGPQPGATDDGCERDVYTLTSCGDCDVTCDPLNAVGDCSSGTCLVGACQSGWANCNFFIWGCETHVAVDLINCGKCGNACATRPNSTPTCSTGVCTLNCQTGWGNCNNEYDDGCETNTTANTSHCGACAKACPNPAHASGYCEASTCEYACDTGWGDCNFVPTDGCEADLAEPSHCGSCGNSCPVRANAARTCEQGVCGFSCNPGWADCNGQAGDGCEANLGDVTSCGACGVTCPSRPNATTTCVSGQCGFDCVGGWGDCNGQAADGCETNLTLTSNCGTCGNVCTVGPNGTATCVSGQCGIACTTGWANCNASLADGCEANLSLPAHCGSCGNVCPARANASTTCTSGTCGFACNTGFGDCDGTASNGCEVTLGTNASHCGTCGNLCPVPANATATCVGGACGFNCTTGWGNCDGNAANGCEANFSQNIAHCGGCGQACTGTFPHATVACLSGSCGIVCEAGWGDCDGVMGNGCEVDLESNADHCGTCSVACPDATNASGVCAGGACGLQCDTGWGNCDLGSANGCEADLTDPATCGSCSNACSVPPGASATCSTGGVCGFACLTDRGDCDGDPANGCERNLTNDPDHCGSCMTACPSGGPNTVRGCASKTCSLACEASWEDCNNDLSDGCECGVGCCGGGGACTC